MANCLAPGYLKLFYTSNGHDHVQTLPVKPASVSTGFALNKSGGGTITQVDFFAAWLDLIRPFFHTTDSFTGWEAFTQADCSHAPVFQNDGTFSSENGSSGSADVQWTQADFTFKTALGGRFKITLLETTQAPDQKSALAGLTGSWGDLRDYLIGVDSAVWARDNQPPAIPLNFVTKTNDALRKKYLHP